MFRGRPKLRTFQTPFANVSGLFANVSGPFPNVSDRSFCERLKCSARTLQNPIDERCGFCFEKFQFWVFSGFLGPGMCKLWAIFPLSYQNQPQFHQFRIFCRCLQLFGDVGGGGSFPRRASGCKQIFKVSHHV